MLFFQKMGLNSLHNHWLKGEFEKKRDAAQVLYKNWQTRPPPSLSCIARDNVVCGWFVHYKGPGPLRIPLLATHANSKLTFWGWTIPLFHNHVLHPHDKKPTCVIGHLNCSQYIVVRMLLFLFVTFSRYPCTSLGYHYLWSDVVYMVFFMFATFSREHCAVSSIALARGALFYIPRVWSCSACTTCRPSPPPLLSSRPFSHSGTLAPWTVRAGVTVILMSASPHSESVCSRSSLTSLNTSLMRSPFPLRVTLCTAVAWWVKDIVSLTPGASRSSWRSR